jgi:RNA polymerase sigma factor (sigma-70 family)
MLAREACLGLAMHAQPSPSPARRDDLLARRSNILDELLRSHIRELKGIARYHSPPAEVDDALQDACMSFLRKFDPDVGLTEHYPLAWMITTVKRAGWARRRALTGRWQHLLTEVDEDAEPAVDRIPDPGPDPDRIVAGDEEAWAVGEMMAQLKPQERQTISLKALGFSYTEIEEITGFSQTKINRCMVEGRARLRELAGRD